MNITFGKSTRWNNGPTSWAIVAAFVAVVALAGVGVWQLTGSDSGSTTQPVVLNQVGDEFGSDYAGIGQAYIDSRVPASALEALDNSRGLGQAGEGSRVLAPQLTLDAELAANPSLDQGRVSTSAPQFGTAADADYAARGLNSQPATVYSPEFFYGLGQPEQAVQSNVAPLIDPTDFGSLGIESALQPQFGTAADAVYAVETMISDPHFGTGPESISVIEGIATLP